MSANKSAFFRSATAFAMAVPLTIAAFATDAEAAKKWGPVITQHLGAIDFQPVEFIGSLTTDYVTPGGVRVTGGETYYNAPIRLPVGTKVLSIEVFLNPNGISADIAVHRYHPKKLKSAEVAATTSTNGTEVEGVFMDISEVVKDKWNYRIDSLYMIPDGHILYGAKITYRLPK